LKVGEQMAILTIDEAKAYIRVDADNVAEDDLIQLFIDNAEGYLKDGIADYDIKIANARFENKAKLLTLAMVQDMYDNRQLTTKDNEKYKLLVSSFILQMQYGTYE
jgi:uncharacterized phage protein (predicted DNA packaging)